MPTACNRIPFVEVGVKNVLAAVGLLICSNSFRNVAWHGHLKVKDKPTAVVILVTGSIAIFEYRFQVLANRIGNETLTVTQLRVMQEAISLTTLAVFAFFVFREKPTSITSSPSFFWLRRVTSRPRSES